jgi:glucose-6-phosphate 1-dehydrogenase
MRTSDPCVCVIFGASGDLTQRKLLPALAGLLRDGLLPGGFTAVGFARRDLGDEGFRKVLRDGVAEFGRGEGDPALVQEMARGLFYCRGEFGDAEAYERLRALLERIDRERGTRGNRLFYLATPPDAYEVILANLARSKLSVPPAGGFARVIVEKPFGRDLASAQKLNAQVLEAFAEGQVFRIDHYLGKETVQNILVFRFANGIFEPLWNQKYVDHVQITVAETVGVEGRAGYFEQAGIARDMIQNHMLQVLCMTAMEAPSSFAADAVRDEKVKVLRSIRPLTREQALENTVRAQYGPGFIGGKPVPAYREEDGVEATSVTETYVAARIHLDNWRWAGVPFYLRSGKRLPRRVTEVAIAFKQAPHLLFAKSGCDKAPDNQLILRIQPDEGIALKFASKVPGIDLDIRDVKMDFRYGTSFGRETSDAYERLLLDAMLGDSTLFTRRDEVEEAWAFVDRILAAWNDEERESLPTYEAGKWGPTDADELLTRDGRAWRKP